MSPRLVGILFLIALAVTVLAIIGAAAVLGSFAQLTCPYTPAACR